MKVSYTRSYPIGAFLQEKIGFEIDADDNASSIAILQMLKDLCDEAHKKLNQGLYIEGNTNGYSQPPSNPYPQPIPEQQVERTPRQATIDQLILEISTCKDMKNIEVYKWMLRQYPEIRDAYDMQLQIINSQ